ncbi:syntaxin-22-like [Arachis ipaensis]|uniref:syntaxin-22-like n=1 Tax=Arachis ipaensis TaxID=130454 RepID=UPI000A2B288E|nr:syntaxin-22-like [Arachis ipaensis]XP_025670399.1 syntaxin-22-like [Arachis hypogaea]
MSKKQRRLASKHENFLRKSRDRVAVFITFVDNLQKDEYPAIDADEKVDSEENVLKEFQKAQRPAAEKETSYTPFVPQAAPSSYTANEADANSGKTPEQRALVVESRRQEVLFLDNEIAFNEAIIEEREHGIQAIQQQIGKVNEIFKDLAVLELKTEKIDRTKPLLVQFDSVVVKAANRTVVFVGTEHIGSVGF